MTRWWKSHLASFDTETTGVDPATARIVSAAYLLLGAKGIASRATWLVNPSIDIPEGATAVHGITTEQARADGMEAGRACDEIARALMAAWSDGLPVVIMNAGYDLSLLQAELARHGHPSIPVGPVLDPLVIDRVMVPFRRGKGARTLTALAGHYDVEQGEAHSAEGDCLTAARVVWKQARQFDALRAMDLDELQIWQAKAHRDWADNFGGYLRSVGKTDDVERDWPVRAVAVTA